MFIFWAIIILNLSLSFIDKMLCLPLLLFVSILMISLTKEKRYDMIDALNSTFGYLDDLLNIDNIHFEQMVHRIYPAELHRNSDTKTAINRDHT